jgi:hypothetical protein
MDTKLEFVQLAKVSVDTKGIGAPNNDPNPIGGHLQQT